MMAAQGLLYLLHETLGLEGVRVGECKAGCSHLLTFLPEPSANTPAMRHHSPELARAGMGACLNAQAADRPSPQERRRLGCWTAAG